MPSLPTEGERYASLMEHLRLAQEDAAMLAHLAGAHNRPAIQRGWLAVSEMFKRTQHAVTQLAMGKMR